MRIKNSKHFEQHSFLSLLGDPNYPFLFSWGGGAHRASDFRRTSRSHNEMSLIISFLGRAPNKYHSFGVTKPSILFSEAISPYLNHTSRTGYGELLIHLYVGLGQHFQMWVPEFSHLNPYLNTKINNSLIFRDAKKSYRNQWKFTCKELGL